MSTATLPNLEIPNFLPDDIDALQKELDTVHAEISTQEITDKLKQLEARNQINALEKGFEERQEVRDNSFWESCKDTFSKVADTMKTVVEWTVVKPAELVWDFVKKHPYWSLAIAMSAVGAYYYFGVVGVGLEQLPKQAAEFYQNMGKAGAPSGGIDTMMEMGTKGAEGAGLDLMNW